MFHRVFAHLQGDIWMGVEWMAERQPITPELDYVTLALVNPSHQVCITLPDGKVLCDFSPDHDHTPFVDVALANNRQSALRLTRG